VRATAVVGRRRSRFLVLDRVRLVATDRPIVATYLGTRALLLALAAVAETVLPRNSNLTSGDPSPILRSLTSWDGWWYLGIAHDGYHAAALVDGYHDYAFLPLYPMLVRVLSLGIPAVMGPVSVVLSNVLLLVALLLLARLGTVYLGASEASFAATLVAIAPFAAVFGMAYAESLFLVLVVGAFLAVERDRLPVAGLLLALASLTRLQGALLLVPLGLLAIERAHGLRARQLWLLLGPAAAVVFVAYAAIVSGSASGFSSAQAAWGRAGIAAAQSPERLGSNLSPQNLVSLLTLCVVLFVVLATWRRTAIPVGYRLVPILFLGAVLASGILESTGRYAVVAFPIAWSIAERLGRGRRAVVVVSVLGALLAATATASFTGWLVP